MTSTIIFTIILRVTSHIISGVNFTRLLSQGEFKVKYYNDILLVFI